MTAGGIPVSIAGYSVLSGLGRGAEALLAGALAGAAAIRPVDRFDVGSRRVHVAMVLPGVADLRTELRHAIQAACAEAGLSEAERGECPLFLAVHGPPVRPGLGVSAGAFGRSLAREMGLRAAYDPDDPPPEPPEPPGPPPDTAVDVRDEHPGSRNGRGTAVDATHGLGAKAEKLGTAVDAKSSGPSRKVSAVRVYTSACVAASSAIADAAALIRAGRVERVVVAAGYLVESDQFALFDAGRALAADGVTRPFSKGRKGMLLGDGVAAVVLQAGSGGVAEVLGWGRAGEGYHVCQPNPEGLGLAAATEAALRRAGLSSSDIGYINAHGTGTEQSDAAEAAALWRVGLQETPISSTKSIHGHALEATGLLELISTVEALRVGVAPVNAGFIGPADECRVDVVTEPGRPIRTRVGLSVNSAFGGANTALVVRAR